MLLTNTEARFGVTVGRKQQYILYFSLFQVMIGFGLVIPILPHFAKELGANAFQMGLLISVWATAQFLFSPFWGSLSDRVGRRPMIMLGLAGYALTFAGMAIATNIWAVMLARFLGGVLTAATIPTAQAYVADTSTGAERTSRMTAMGAAMNIGFLCGPALGGLLSVFGFRGTLVSAALLGLFNLILAYFTLPEPARRQQAAVKRKQFNTWNAVTLAIRGPEAMLFIMAFVGTFGGSTLFGMLGFFMADRFGAGPQLLAVAFTIEGLVTVCVQVFLITRLVHWVGEGRAISLAFLSGMAGFGTLIFAQNFWHVLPGLVLVGIAFATVRPLITAMVSKRTRLEQGMTMGIQTAFDALGRMLGPLWAGAVYLWRDWAPFASAIVLYGVFYILNESSSKGRKPAELATPPVAD